MLNLKRSLLLRGVIDVIQLADEATYKEQSHVQSRKIVVIMPCMPLGQGKPRAVLFLPFLQGCPARIKQRAKAASNSCQ